jgi:uncharacterized flavoprotein (TIGR03862 family)
MEGSTLSQIAIIGAGPAGLMAAEVLSSAGEQVTIFEAMPTVGRKLLMAGKSGLNITHGEAHSQLLSRYGAATPRLKAALDAFTAEAVTEWCAGLGIETFVGSSGRVFPKAMKASPLLRAWMVRLGGLGVEVRTRHRWLGFDGEALVFETPAGRQVLRFDAVVLATGGASWPKLGSDGAWAQWLDARGVAIAPFRPANCGFEVNWSALFVERFAGEPLKSVTATSAQGTVPGEFVVSRWGVEGSLVYAHAAVLRDGIERDGSAQLLIDLMPGRSVERLTADLARQPKKLSFSNRLRKGAGLDPVKAGLVREVFAEAGTLEAGELAKLIKALPIRLERARPITEAISTDGGVRLEGIDERFMLTALPGVFAAGEMLDWEAPTGGYLLTACLATGRAAAKGVMDYLATE